MEEKKGRSEWKKLSVQITISLFLAWIFVDYLQLSSTAIIIFPIAIAFFFLRKYCKKQEGELREKKWFYLLFAVMISSMLVLCKHIVIQFHDFYVDSTVDYIKSFSWYDLLALIVLIYEFILISYTLVKFLQKEKISLFVKVTGTEKNIRKVGIQSKKPMFILMTVILLCWIPYLILYYPSFIYGDSTVSISQALGRSSYNSHHPIMYTLFIKLCFFLGSFSGGNTLGCAIYSILQMILMALIFAYSVCWLRNKNVSKTVCVIVFLFFAIPRFWAQHAISMWKDPLFSLFVYFYSLKLFDLIWSKGEVSKDWKYLLQCAASLLGFCFFRNNGIYVAMFSLVMIILCSYLGKRKWMVSRSFILSTVICLILVQVIQGPVYKMLGITGDPVETYGVPLQQVARTVVYNGKISDEEKEFLNQIMPLEKYKENYSPGLVDHFKWSEDFNTEFFNEHQTEFVKIWISLLIKNPKLYFEAWELNSCGYWGLSYWQLNNFTANISMGVPRGEQIREAYRINVGSLLKDGSTRDTFLKKYFSMWTPMPSIALCFWIALFMILMTIIEGKLRYVLFFAPCIGNILTLFIASPITYWPRYGLSFICLLPLSLIFPYLLEGDSCENATDIVK